MVAPFELLEHPNPAVSDSCTAFHPEGYSSCRDENDPKSCLGSWSALGIPADQIQTQAAQQFLISGDGLHLLQMPEGLFLQFHL